MRANVLRANQPLASLSYPAAVLLPRACAVGEPEVSLELDTGASIPAAIDALTAAYPQLAKMLPRCALALNGEYVQDTVVLAEGNELAVLPPMSGG